jgi:dUTP pyrophosphatase
MFYLKMQKLRDDAIPFKEGEREDAGYDIFGWYDVIIPSGGFGLFETGIATEFPPGYVGLILDRSGLGFKGLMKLAGVIDSGYRDQWRVKLYNATRKDVTIERGKACAQVVFVRYEKVKPELVSTLGPSLRGLKGYGSSDVRPSS